MISLLKKFIKIKIKFIKPRNAEVLIYDRQSLPNAELLFNKSTFEILDTRYESLNIYVLIKTILKYGITNIKKNYKRTFFELVSPKIIYTSIDNTPAFFLLKQIYNKVQYIADQGSMRDNAFYNSSLELLKKKIILECDYIFALGENDVERFKKVINIKKSNILIAGQTKNNSINIITTTKKIKYITYISSKFDIRGDMEYKILKNLIKFCKENSFKLYYLDRQDDRSKKTLYEKFEKKDIAHIKFLDLKEKYTFLSKSKIIVFAHSTLGYECLSRNLKCMSLNHQEYFHGLKRKYKNEGPFWIKTNNYINFRNKINKILNYSDKQWKRISNKFSSEILYYDNNNVLKKKVIKKILS